MVSKIFSLLVSLLLLGGFVFASTHIQSPEASAFSQTGRGAEPGVTGEIGFDVPLGAVSGRGGFDLPISLSYSPSLKLDQEASWVGLGFSLGFGAITRNPVGIPDDYENGYLNFFPSTQQADYGDQDYYYVNLPGLSGKIAFKDRGEDYYGNSVPYFTNGQKAKIVMYMYDEFTDSFINYADYAKDYYTDPPSSQMNFRVDMWEIISVDGTRYLFGRTPESRAYSKVNKTDTNIKSWINTQGKLVNWEGSDTHLSDPFINAWYLTDILSPDYQDNGLYGHNLEPSFDDFGNWIKIDYSKAYEGDYYNYKSPNPRTYHFCEIPDNCGNSECADWVDCDNNHYDDVYGYEYSGIAVGEGTYKPLSLFFVKSETSVQMVYPQKITTPNMHAEFVFDFNREDGRDFSEPAAKKLAKLNEIRYYSSGSQGDNYLFKNVFNYAPDTQELAKNADGNPDKGRLTLESVKTFGLNGEGEIPEIKFDYYNRDDKYHRYAWDWWGNYNGEVENKYIPLSLIGDYCVSYSDGYCNGWDWDALNNFFQGQTEFPLINDKIPNHSATDKIKSWTISKVQYSTGATIEYDYEVGEYQYERDQLLDSPVKAGIRLKSKTLDDGFGDRYTVEYEYGPSRVIQDLGWENKYRVDWTKLGPHAQNGVFYEWVKTIMPTKQVGHTINNYDLSLIEEIGLNNCVRNRYVGSLNGQNYYSKIERDLILEYIPSLALLSSTEMYNSDGELVQYSIPTYETVSVTLYAEGDEPNINYDDDTNQLDCNSGYDINMVWLKLSESNEMKDGISTRTTYQYNPQNRLPSVVKTYGNGYSNILEKHYTYRAYEGFESNYNLKERITSYLNYRHILSLPSKTTIKKGNEELSQQVHMYSFWESADEEGYKMIETSSNSFGVNPIYLSKTYNWLEDFNNNDVADFSIDKYSVEGISSYDVYGQPLEIFDSKNQKTTIYYGTNENPCSYDQKIASELKISSFEEDIEDLQMAPAYQPVEGEDGSMGLPVPRPGGYVPPVEERCDQYFDYLDINGENVPTYAQCRSYLPVGDRYRVIINEEGSSANNLCKDVNQHCVIGPAIYHPVDNVCSWIENNEFNGAIYNCVDPVCGNDQVEPFEQCDNTNLQGKSCSNLGFNEGSLSCNSVCKFDISSCGSDFFDQAISPTCVEDNVGNQISAKYDGYGKLSEMTDINGIKSYYFYDNLNRLSEVRNSVDDSYVMSDYNYGLNNCDSLIEGDESCMNWVQTKTKFSSDSGDSVSRSYVDGLGRPMQTKSLESDSNAIKVRTYYNERGFVDSVTRPEDSPISWPSKLWSTITGEDIEDALLKYDIEEDSLKEEGSQDSVKYVYYDDPTGRVWKTFPYSSYSEGDENLECSSAEADCVQEEYALSDSVECGDPGFTCVKTIDTEGKYIKTRINKLGHVVEVEDMQDSYTYVNDILGKPLEIFDKSDRKVVSNKYDKAGRVIETSDLNSGKKVYRYDEKGNILFLIEAYGTSDQRTKTFEYDELDRLIKICINIDEDSTSCSEDDKVLLKYYYDSYDGDRNQQDRCGDGDSTYGYLCKVQEFVDPNNPSTLVYYYDRKGRVNYLSESIDGESFVTAYNYDYLGSIESISYPNGEEISYDYDRLGRLSNLGGNGVTDLLGSIDLDYNPSGTIDTITFPDSLQEFDYTSKDLVENIRVQSNGNTIFEESYQYTDSGNLKKIEDLVNGVYADFEYDDLYRLDSFGDLFGVGNYYGSDFGVVSYDYDSSGNRLYRYLENGDGSGIITPMEYKYQAASYLEPLKNSDRLTQTIDEDSGEICNYDYDNHGNMIEKDCNLGGKTVYNYDENDMISSIFMPGGAIMEFRYDALGRRIYKKEVEDDFESVTIYVYGLGSQPLMVIEKSDSSDEGFNGEVHNFPGDNIF